jgi:hypothetical protein
MRLRRRTTGTTRINAAAGDLVSAVDEKKRAVWKAIKLAVFHIVRKSAAAGGRESRLLQKYVTEILIAAP